MWAGFRHGAASVALRVARYETSGAPLVLRRCVVVAAPHTSHWDFALMLSFAWRHDIPVKWMGKREMIGWPMRRILIRVGGIPVDRSNPAGLASEIASGLDDVALVIPVEGTTLKRQHWKSGFRRIAMSADVPVVLAFVDRPTRTVGIGPTLMMTDDVGRDMDQIRHFYATICGIHPEKATLPRLRSEDS